MKPNDLFFSLKFTCKGTVDMDEILDSSESGLIDFFDAMESFEREYKLSSTLNVFEAVSMVKQEIRHSRFLAFMLDPSKPHGLGDIFLRKFLMMASIDHPTLGVSRLKMVMDDLDDCLVYCERDHFDITVEIPSLKLLLVIENKIGAIEGDQQLKKYKDAAIDRYKDYKFMGVFLTPDGYDGEDDDWKTVSYKTVIDCLKESIKFVSDESEIAILIRNYIQLVERYIMNSPDLIDACKKIYQKHHVAIDLICKYGQIGNDDFYMAFDEFILDAGAPCEVPVKRNGYVVFYPINWKNINENLKANRSKWSSDFPIHLIFEIKGKYLYLRMQVGPFEDIDGERNNLIKELRNKITGSTQRNITDTYTNIVTFKQIISETPSADELMVAMKKLWINGKKWGDSVEETLRAAYPQVLLGAQ